MRTKPSRRIALKVSAVFAACLTSVVVAFWIWIDSVAERRWKELEALVERLEAEARAREDERPVLRGAAMPGQGWEEYERALRKAKLITASNELVEFVDNVSTADRPLVEKELAAHSILLDHVARGARKTIGPRRIEWNTAPDDQGTEDLLEASTISYFIACKARLLAEEGKTDEALDILLDGCQFGRDCEDNAMLLISLVGADISDTCLNELLSMVVSKAFTAKQLARLDRALELLDHHHPKHGEILRNETLFMGYVCLNDPDIDPKAGWDLPFLYGWRYGFSDRLILADAITTRLTLLEKVVAAEGEPWKEMERALGKVERAAESSTNPILGQLMEYLRPMLEESWRHRARLRLLRAAVGYRRTGRVPLLQDPFGTDLRHSRSAGSVKMWSVGPNGIDDGGTGGWKDTSDSDIVVELKE